jgi:competence protein CoiA
MLTALSRINPAQKVYANNSTKFDGPFICPLCKEEVIIHKGMVKVHHFKHKNSSNCNFGAGETEMHRLIKTSIAKDISDLLKFDLVDLEHDLGYAIPDVYISFHNTKIAIEIQKSNVTPGEVLQRTKRYYANKTAVLWICTPFDISKSDKYAPKAWEKWCHATYFGRCYYWLEGQILQPVHFDKYMLYREESSWFEDGSEQYGGGYEYHSKRFKTAILGPEVAIAKDFVVKKRDQKMLGSLIVPECLLFLDNNRKWW